MRVAIGRTLLAVPLMLVLAAVPSYAEGEQEETSTDKICTKDTRKCAKFYFGQIHTVAPGNNDADKFESLLRMLSSCHIINDKCDPGEEILKELFRGTHRDRLPDFIVYLEKNGDTLEANRPVLMWRKKNTPYIFGARHFYVMVFSEERVSLNAKITTIYKKPMNPFQGVIALLTQAAPATEDDKEPVSVTERVSWEPLSGDRENPGMWVGGARLPVKPNSVNRVTVSFPQPNYKLTTTKTTKPRAKSVPQERTTDTCPAATIPIAKVDPAEKVTVEETSTIEGYAPVLKVPKASFAGVNGHFSNSKASLAAFSLVLAATMKTEHTAVGDGNNATHFNGYAAAKFYLPQTRPALRVGPERKTVYRPSLGFIVGTNVTGDTFDEIIVGLSAGHLVGSVGAVAAANRIAGNEDYDRKWRLLLGVEYTF